MKPQILYSAKNKGFDVDGVLIYFIEINRPVRNIFMYL